MSAAKQSQPVTKADFEKFTELVIGEFGSVRSEMSDMRTEMNSIRTEMNQRFSQVDRQFDEVRADLHAIRSELRDIRQRVEALEDAVKNHGGFAKEIDQLYARIAAIEQHLGISST